VEVPAPKSESIPINLRVETPITTGERNKFMAWNKKHCFVSELMSTLIGTVQEVYFFMISMLQVMHNEGHGRFNKANK